MRGTDVFRFLKALVTVLLISGCAATRGITEEECQLFLGEGEFTVPFPVRAERPGVTYSFERSSAVTQVQNDRFIAGIARVEPGKTVDHQTLPLKDITKIWLGTRIHVRTREGRTLTFPGQRAYLQIANGRFTALHGLEEESGERMEIPVGDISSMDYERLDFQIPAAILGGAVLLTLVMILLL